MKTDVFVKIAERIVGVVGESTDRLHSVTGQEYVEFALKFKEDTDIVLIWTNWILAYKKYAKYVFTGFLLDMEKPLVLYWREKPSILKDKDEEEQAFYARLLISNKISREKA